MSNAEALSDQELRGSIEIETQRGQGTTVRFRIPKENNWSVDIKAVPVAALMAASTSGG